jgi:hypothetical protein
MVGTRFFGKSQLSVQTLRDVLMSVIDFGVNFPPRILGLVCQILLLCCVPCAGFAAARDLTAVNKEIRALFGTQERKTQE